MQRCIGDESFKDTGLFYTLKLIKGKYKMRVLYTLMEFGVVRLILLNRARQVVNTVARRSMCMGRR